MAVPSTALRVTRTGVTLVTRHPVVALVLAVGVLLIGASVIFPGFLQGLQVWVTGARARFFGLLLVEGLGIGVVFGAGLIIPQARALSQLILAYFRQIAFGAIGLAAGYGLLG